MGPVGVSRASSPDSGTSQSASHRLPVPLTRLRTRQEGAHSGAEHRPAQQVGRQLRGLPPSPEDVPSPAQ